MNIWCESLISPTRVADLSPFPTVEYAHAPAPLLRRRSASPDGLMEKSAQLDAPRRRRKEGELPEIRSQYSLEVVTRLG